MTGLEPWRNAPEVLQSSGSARLDEAAQAWARAARWIPATRDNKPVDGCTKIKRAVSSAGMKKR